MSNLNEDNDMSVKSDEEDSEHDVPTNENPKPKISPKSDPNSQNSPTPKETIEVIELPTKARDLLGVDKRQQKDKTFEFHSDLVACWKETLTKGMETSTKKEILEKYPSKGICRSADFIKNGEILSSKSGVTAKFVQDKSATKKDQGVFSGYTIMYHWFCYNNECYSFPGGTCRCSEDCLSTSYSCQSGTCKSSDFIKNGEILSSKPGVTAKFIQDQKATKKDQGFLSGNDWGAPLYVCRISLLDYVVPGKLIAHKKWNDCHVPIEESEVTQLSYELLVGSNLEWKSSVYQPDKAIYGGHQDNGLPYLIC
ncbi:hypothetical protein KQX54_007737 [Cotesia glomerata]|uniref:Uncharacterized protein n=1 Tax=Cotesia glomerata TaxID=32391 RepID=A0AAV7HZL3_COTGL|nr:hypothetical protein KQX54_007737 [Cotesia glomerata]